MDNSHAYASEQAQALTEWMDDFFGDPIYDLDQAESWLRLELASDWDEEDGNDLKLRLRGKVQLPRISKRLDLVFSGEDGHELDRLDEEERQLDDQVGLQYEVRRGARSRLDGLEWRTRLTLRQRRYADTKRPLVFGYFGSITGETDPESYITNYRIGALVRGQIYRKYLYLEVEPASNFRRRNFDEDRNGAWSTLFKIEVHLNKDLRRVKSKGEGNSRRDIENAESASPASGREGDLL